MPTLTNPVYLDGTSQDGVSCGASFIELDGSLLPANPPVAGLTLGPGSANSTIRGLAINRFSGPALEVTSANNTLSCSRLGIRVTAGDAPGTNKQGAVDLNSGGQLALDTTDEIGGTVKVHGGNLKITNHVVINVNNH